MCGTNGKAENTAEILLVSPDEYEKPIKEPQSLDILKLRVNFVFLITLDECSIDARSKYQRSLPNINDAFSSSAECEK